MFWLRELQKLSVKFNNKKKTMAGNIQNQTGNIFLNYTFVQGSIHCSPARSHHNPNPLRAFQFAHSVRKSQFTAVASPSVRARKSFPATSATGEFRTAAWMLRLHASRRPVRTIYGIYHTHRLGAGLPSHMAATDEHSAPGIKMSLNRTNPGTLVCVVR